MSDVFDVFYVDNNQYPEKIKKTIESVKDKVDEFVQKYLEDEYVKQIPFYKEGKVIHDALWGTQYIKPHELVILDTPLLQRLRQIKQTGFTYLIYPSSLHTRFEHTLGVLSQASKMIEALKREPKYQEMIQPYEDTIRLAALLHDVGHGPFSHTSEEFYRYCDDFKILLYHPESPFSGWTPHELLSCLIITSKTFRNFFDTRIRDDYNQTSIDVDLIAKIIVGQIGDPLKLFVQSIINGPFDADKLDYIFRDGHFSGLPLKVDLDRLWYSLQINDIDLSVINSKGKIKTLTVPANSIGPLQQILFAKMVLFSSVYHHHKVRALDCMFKSFCIFARGEELNFNNKCSFSRATDFLWLTDYNFFNYADVEPRAHKILHNMLYRRLLKRALVISKSTTSGYSVIKKYAVNERDRDPYLRNLAEKIWIEAGKPCDKEDIWVDLPSPPPRGIADRTFIKKSENEFVPLSKIFKVDDWAENYIEHLWRGHVFGPPDDEIRKKISKAAKKVFQEEFDVKFNNFTDIICKLN